MERLTLPSDKVGLGIAKPCEAQKQDMSLSSFTDDNFTGTSATSTSLREKASHGKADASKLRGTVFVTLIRLSQRKIRHPRECY